MKKLTVSVMTAAVFFTACGPSVPDKLNFSPNVNMERTIVVDKSDNGTKNVQRMPLIGEKLPTLKVNTTHGQMTLPDAYAGKWFILFSHPADFTPVCTTEFVAFQMRYPEFRKRNVELIGLSIDQVFSHLKWIEWIRSNIKNPKTGKPVEIQFPIIGDDTGKVARRLGLIHPAKGSTTVRAVFIVDPKGIIRAILYYPQELGRNIDEFIRMIDGFQASDKEKVAIPAGWPNNELFGSDAIIPPAGSVDQIKQRRQAEKEGKIKCLDWWLCHKPLGTGPVNVKGGE